MHYSSRYFAQRARNGDFLLELSPLVGSCVFWPDSHGHYLRTVEKMWPLARWPFSSVLSCRCETAAAADTNPSDNRGGTNKTFVPHGREPFLPP
jgi:hypothetical protein